MGKKETFGAVGAFYPFLMNNVRQMYKDGVKTLGVHPSTWTEIRDGFNGYCEQAPSAYIILTSVWEAAINYHFIDDFSIRPYHELLQHLDPSSRQWSIERKTFVFPLIMFGKTFDQSKQPFQDFIKLLNLRNSLVHHKEANWPTKIVKDLASKKLTLPAESNLLYGWPLQICSLAGVRWGINTICRMLEALSTILPEECRSSPLFVAKSCYLSDSKVRELFIELGVDPEYQSPLSLHYPDGVRQM
jgi:hypothetical protein